MYKKQISDKDLKDRFEIVLLSENYLRSKRIIREYEDNNIDINFRRIAVHHRIVNHIEYVVESMHDKEKIIIENEVLRGKKGKWYKAFMSAPSYYPYYRYRKSAYHNFLRCL